MRVKPPHVTKDLVPLLLVSLALLLLGLSQLASTPLTHYHSQQHEAQADAYGLRLMRDREACAGVVRKLQGGNLSVPDPFALEHSLRGFHPTMAERMRACRELPIDPGKS